MIRNWSYSKVYNWISSEVAIWHVYNKNNWQVLSVDWNVQ